MKKILSALALATCMTAHIPTATAMPAYPRLVSVTQPDGTTVTLLLKGDERLHWAETPDGYTLVQGEGGFWNFATQAADGTLTATNLRYSGTSQPAIRAGIRPHLRHSPRQVASVTRQLNADGSLQIAKTFPAKGKCKLLLLLVNYGNTTPTYAQTDFEKMMNQEGYGGIGSFRDYYLQASYGLLDIEVTVSPWINLAYPKDYYGSDGAVRMIEEALNAYHGEIDLSQFDNDGDGVLDGLAVIHQGGGQEYTGSIADIWSHSSTIKGMSYDGVRIGSYTMQPETVGNTGEMTSIGVICHEFGHNLGAPDFYDTDYAGSGGDYPGTGLWDLMGSGAWNGNNGDRPAGINAWQKWQLGWCEPQTLNAPCEVTDMPSADNAPVAYRIDTHTPGDYYIMENRQQAGPFDAALPGHGLIVYHANEELMAQRLADNLLNATHPQAFYTVCADAATDPTAETYTYGLVNSAYAPFPGEGRHTAFNDLTAPSLHSTDGRYAYCALADISEHEGKISFTFTQNDLPPTPENFTATTQRGVVTLAWTLPQSARTLNHFTLYRDGEPLATTTECRYTDTAPATGGRVTYAIDATYVDGLVSPCATTSLRIPLNHALNLSATPDESGTVQVRWDAQDKLTRTSAGTDYGVATYATDALDYAHRYTDADLATYVGYTISRIAFVPAQSPAVAKYWLRVWEAAPSDGTPAIVSERQVKEFGLGVARDLLLTHPVTIEAGKDYWIGVRCESTEGSVSVLTDRSGATPGRGNCVNDGGSWRNDSTLAGNFCLTATITPPANPLQGVPPQVPDSVGNPDTDLLFPAAFRVYRDGELLATTTGHGIDDADAPGGTHTYSVVSLYAGGNESAPATATVDVPTAIGQAPMAPAPPAIATTQGALWLPAFEGWLHVADAAGRTVLSAPYAGARRIALPAGTYLVSATSQGGTTSTTKVLIR